MTAAFISKVAFIAIIFTWIDALRADDKFPIAAGDDGKLIVLDAAEVIVDTENNTHK
jgi:hypothetical protein